MNNIDWTAAVSIGFFDEMGEIEKAAAAGIFGRLAGKLISPIVRGTRGAVRVTKNLAGNKKFMLTDGVRAGASDKARVGAANAALWAGRNPLKATAGIAGTGYLALKK